MEWISVKDRQPNDEELKRSKRYEFLCRGIVPMDGGFASEKIDVIRYDTLNRQWNCSGVIITHWMQIPEITEEENNK